MNCWEFQKCDNKKTCPVFPFNGRKCAIIMGMLCNGEVQDNYGDKLERCFKCDYFRSVFHVKTAA